MYEFSRREVSGNRTWERLRSGLRLGLGVRVTVGFLDDSSYGRVRVRAMLLLVVKGVGEIYIKVRVRARVLKGMGEINI